MKQVMYCILENYDPEMVERNRRYTVNWRTLTLPGPGVKANLQEEGVTHVIPGSMEHIGIRKMGGGKLGRPGSCGSAKDSGGLRTSHPPLQGEGSVDGVALQSLLSDLCRHILSPNNAPLNESVLFLLSHLIMPQIDGL